MQPPVWSTEKKKMQGRHFRQRQKRSCMTDNARAVSSITLSRRHSTLGSLTGCTLQWRHTTQQGSSAWHHGLPFGETAWHGASITSVPCFCLTNPRSPSCCLEWHCKTAHMAPATAMNGHPLLWWNRRRFPGIARHGVTPAKHAIFFLIQGRCRNPWIEGTAENNHKYRGAAYHLWSDRKMTGTPWIACSLAAPGLHEFFTRHHINKLLLICHTSFYKSLNSQSRIHLTWVAKTYTNCSERFRQRRLRQ